MNITTTKNKSCLLVIPGNHNQDTETTLKLSTFREIITNLEKEKIDFKIATLGGKKLTNQRHKTFPQYRKEPRLGNQERRLFLKRFKYRQHYTFKIRCFINTELLLHIRGTKQ
jgi:hypothetical protein